MSVQCQCVRVQVVACLCTGCGLMNRMNVLIIRLPELKRANIEHCLIAAQVQQMSVPGVEMGTLWRELFLSAGHTPPV